MKLHDSEWNSIFKTELDACVGFIYRQWEQQFETDLKFEGETITYTIKLKNMPGKKREILGEISQSGVKGQALVKALARLNSDEVNQLPKEQPVKKAGK